MKVVKDIKKAKETAVNVMVITDDGGRNILIPMELIPSIIETINKEGECPLMMPSFSPHYSNRFSYW